MNATALKLALKHSSESYFSSFLGTHKYRILPEAGKRGFSGFLNLRRNPVSKMPLCFRTQFNSGCWHCFCLQLMSEFSFRLRAWKTSNSPFFLQEFIYSPEVRESKRLTNTLVGWRGLAQLTPSDGGWIGEQLKSCITAVWSGARFSTSGAQFPRQ